MPRKAKVKKPGLPRTPPPVLVAFLEESESAIEVISEVYEYCARIGDIRNGVLQWVGAGANKDTIVKVKAWIEEWNKNNAQTVADRKALYGDEKVDFFAVKKNKSMDLETWVRAYDDIMEESNNTCERWKNWKEGQPGTGPIANYQNVKIASVYIVNMIAKRLVDENKILNGYQRGPKGEKPVLFGCGNEEDEGADEYKQIQQKNGTYWCIGYFLFCCVLLSWVWLGYLCCVVLCCDLLYYAVHCCTFF